MGIKGRGWVGEGKEGKWGDRGRDKPLPLLYWSEGCAGSKHPLKQYSRGCGLSLPWFTSRFLHRR